MASVYKITIDDRAWVELDGITDFYVNELERPDSAKKIILGIFGKINRLNPFPKIGPVVCGDVDIEVRRTHYKKYNIYFEVREKEKEIRILDILPPHKDFKMRAI